MSFGPLLLAFVSLALIVAGVVVMLRHVRAKRAPVQMPPAPVPNAGHAARSHDARSHATARSERGADTARTLREPTPAQRFPEASTEVTIVRREPKAAAADVPPGTSGAGSDRSAFAALKSAVATILADATAEVADTAAEGQRWPSVESRWPLTENLVERVVAHLNEALAPVALRIGQPGEAGWSFKNRGFGSYHRIVIAGRSVAWLRVETNQEQVIPFKVRAHAVEQALLNMTAKLPASDSAAPHALEAQVLETLSTCLRPAGPRRYVLAGPPAHMPVSG